MSPSQSQTTPAPLPADVYSESIEQQFAIIRDFLLTPLGAALLANDPWVRRRVATPSELARHVAARVYRSKPFFVTAEIAQAIFSASRSLPEYTFTAESFPCPKAFVWLQEPICLYEGPRFSRRVLLHAFHWMLDKQLADEEGRLPVLFDGYLVDPDRPKGVPTFHVTVNLGWTLDEHYGTHAGEAIQQLSKPAGSPYHEDLSDILGPVFVRFVASCLSFMEQRITIPVSRPASRATRRRLERKHDAFQPAAEVQVIELRRRERRHHEHADEGDREPPEWHVQWLVAGHWRRHWYPRAKAHKPRYIAPYVKGPQDKPLKPPASQLFVVKR